MTLWKMKNDYDLEYRVDTDSGITFEAESGFILSQLTYCFTGSFQCRATLGEKKQEKNLTLNYIPELQDTNSIFIGYNLYPLVNSTFKVECSLFTNVEQDVKVDWIIPNQHEIGGRINATKLYYYRDSKFPELSTKNLWQVYLVIKDALPSDAGLYRCSAAETKGQQCRLGEAQTEVLVFDPRQPIVKFTSGLDFSKPLVRKLGEDAEFVVKVFPHPGTPGIELYWEKNKERLEANGHYVMVTDVDIETSDVKLYVMNLTFSDAGNYTLCGKTKDALTMMTIVLKVKEPHYVNFISDIDLSEPVIFQVGQNATFTFLVDSFPNASNIEFCWEKNGQPIQENDHYRTNTSDSTVVFEIKNLERSDTANYTLIGKTDDVISSVSIMLEVTEDIPQRSLLYGEKAAFIALGAMALILIIVIELHVKKFLKKKAQKEEFLRDFERNGKAVFNPDLPLEEQIDLLPFKHNCEFTKERLKLGVTLGQGAFGRVVKAEAIGLFEGKVSTIVAVKMLKEGAHTEQRNALIAELKMLLHVGKHLNIVNLLGAVTKNLTKGELYIIVEYCCFGDLRNFLLKHKGRFINQVDPETGEVNTKTPSSQESHYLYMKQVGSISDELHVVMNDPVCEERKINYAELEHNQGSQDLEVYNSECEDPLDPISSTNERNVRDSSPTEPNNDVNGGEEISNNFITTSDLICFAYQCAKGMEYLSSRKLIHRDLAARNVLLAEGNVVKICDFGLSKDCYKYSHYIKETPGLLPIKWMALESIRDKVFSFKSDVWSYGILMWEIFTLGGDPYPGEEINGEFFEKLQGGCRMKKPDLAPDTIYQVMKSCWLCDPDERPDFNCLSMKVGNLLESSVVQNYLMLSEPYRETSKEEALNDVGYLNMAGKTTEGYLVMENLAES